MAAISKAPETTQILNPPQGKFGQSIFTHYGFRSIDMKASARNQLFGTVKEVVPGSVTSEIVITLKGGTELVASVTNKSVITLGLTTGKDVVALIKAPMIILVKDFGGYRLSARNQMTGIIETVHKGTVNSDVVLKLNGGDSIAATITNESADNLSLKKGDSVTAVFKAGTVILGVA